MKDAIEINQSIRNLKYSVCTLVTDSNEYEKMILSFQKQGFNSNNTEFLYISNINNNQYDGYSGLNHMLNTANGKYVILCHQDILLRYDDESSLNKCISELNEKDKSWALAGNAGGDSSRRYRHITDPHGTSNIDTSSQKVQSLDENFIIVNTCNRVALSGNLSGFHMYGTDLCTMADILGYHSYVINFHLQHNSKGNKNKSFYQAEKYLIQKYQNAFRTRFFKTTCTKVIISSSKILTFLLNKKLFRDMVFIFTRGHAEKDTAS